MLTKLLSYCLICPFNIFLIQVLPLVLKAMAMLIFLCSCVGES